MCNPLQVWEKALVTTVKKKNHNLIEKHRPHVVDLAIILQLLIFRFH